MSDQAIQQKLKVTRDQLVTSLGEDHNTIRQFERLFEVINELVIPEQNTSNCFIERYDTGWVANSDWTNTTFTINHGLGEAFPILIVSFLLSKTGDDSDSVEPANTSIVFDQASPAARNDQYGHQIRNIDNDNIEIVTLEEGLYGEVDGAGAVVPWTTESYYYKVVVTKLTGVT